MTENSIDYSLQTIKEIKRPDGLRMYAVRKFTFRDFVRAISTRWGEMKAYNIFRKPEATITYNELRRRAECISTHLLSMGYRKGDKVAVFGEACPNWMTMYLGVTQIGLVAVPILPDFSEKEATQILNESGAKAICVNIKQSKKTRAAAEEGGMQVFCMDDLSIARYEGETIEEGGESLIVGDINTAAIEASEPEEEDMASLIFTSGTTGSSKGVMLSHRNLVANADSSFYCYYKLVPGMQVLSILPMSHVYEFSLGHVLTLMAGMEITCLCKPPAVPFLMPALAEVKPHVMMTVPLLIEKVYKAAVLPKLNDPKIKMLLKTPLTSWIVYKKIKDTLKEKFGGRMGFFGIGGAPLDPEVEVFLRKIDFPYALGYGLTETSPLISACTPDRKGHLLKHIGWPQESCDIKLLDKNSEGVGEIAVKSPYVMMGYYQRDDLNKEVFTEDGYFKTGDLGSFSPDGRIAIRGRSKTMILGAGGENIYPENIESLINNCEYVEESLVLGDAKGLHALIRLNMDALKKKKGTVEEARKFALEYLEELKDKVNKDLAVFSRITSVSLQEEAFERTPTLKIKRFLYTK